MDKVWLQKHNAKLRSICTAILENVVDIERVGENPTVVILRKKEQVLGDTGDLGDGQKDTYQDRQEKNNDVNLNLEEIEGKKSVKGTGVSKETSPPSPPSPRIVEEGNVVAEITNDGVTSIANVTETPDFNYGDFSCPQCERLFPNETNRQMHIESEHLRRLHEPYRSGSKWYCKKCKETGDKFHMQETTCSGIKKK